MLTLQPIDLEAANKETVAAHGGVESPSNIDIRGITSKVNNAVEHGQITTVWQLAAFYCESIAKAHLFSDGNKRTAAICCNMVLLINSYPSLDVQPDSIQQQFEDRVVAIAGNQMGYQELAQWLEETLLGEHSL